MWLKDVGNDKGLNPGVCRAIGQCGYLMLNLLWAHAEDVLQQA